MQIPALCRSCGLPFPSGIVISGQVTNIVLSDNVSGPCPFCGGLGDVLSRTFSTVAGQVMVMGRERALTLAEALRSDRSWSALAQEADAATADLFRVAGPPPGVSGSTWKRYILAIVSLAIAGAAGTVGATASIRAIWPEQPTVVIVEQQPTPPQSTGPAEPPPIQSNP